MYKIRPGFPFPFRANPWVASLVFYLQNVLPNLGLREISKILLQISHESDGDGAAEPRNRAGDMCCAAAKTGLRAVRKRFRENAREAAETLLREGARPC